MQYFLAIYPISKNTYFFLIHFIQGEVNASCVLFLKSFIGKLYPDTFAGVLKCHVFSWSGPCLGAIKGNKTNKLLIKKNYIYMHYTKYKLFIIITINKVDSLFQILIKN